MIFVLGRTRSYQLLFVAVVVGHIIQIFILFQDFQIISVLFQFLGFDVNVFNYFAFYIGQEQKHFPRKVHVIAASVLKKRLFGLVICVHLNLEHLLVLLDDCGIILLFQRFQRFFDVSIRSAKDFEFFGFNKVLRRRKFLEILLQMMASLFNELFVRIVKLTHTFTWQSWDWYARPV